MARQAIQYPQSLPVRISEGMLVDLKRVAEKRNLDVSEVARRFIAEGVARLEQPKNPLKRTT